MSRFSFLIILMLGGAAVAKDGTIQAPRAPAAPIEEEEQFWGSEMGQDIQRLFEDFRSGKKSYDQTHEEFNKKWGGKLDAPIARSAPNAPVVKVPSY